MSLLIHPTHVFTAPCINFKIFERLEAMLLLFFFRVPRTIESALEVTT